MGLSSRFLGIPLAGADQTQKASYATAKKKPYALYVGARAYQSAEIYCGLR